MSQCAACSGAGWQGQAQLLSPRLSQQPPAPLAPSCSPRGSKPRTPLTRDSSFPVAMAIADSKQPVVEKVQQLPQGPYRDEERERNCSRRCCRLTSLPRTWEGGMAAVQSLHSLLAAGIGLLLSPRHGTALGELPWHRHPALLLGHGACPQPSAPSGHVTHSSPGFSQVSRNSPSSSSR